MAEILPPMTFWQMVSYVMGHPTELHVEFPEGYRDANPPPAFEAEERSE